MKKYTMEHDSVLLILMFAAISFHLDMPHVACLFAYGRRTRLFRLRMAWSYFYHLGLRSIITAWLATPFKIQNTLNTPGLFNMKKSLINLMRL